MVQVMAVDSVTQAQVPLDFFIRVSQTAYTKHCLQAYMATGLCTSDSDCSGGTAACPGFSREALFDGVTWLGGTGCASARR